MNVSQNLRNCWYGSPRISCHPQIIIYWMNFSIGEFEGVSPVSPVNSEENFHLLYSYISQLLLITCKLFCPLFFSSLLSSPASLWGLGVSPQSLRPRRCSSPWRWSLRHRWGCANTWPPIILGLWISPWHRLQMDRAVGMSYKLCTFSSCVERKISFWKKLFEGRKDTPRIQAPMHLLSCLLSIPALSLQHVLCLLMTHSSY